MSEIILFLVGLGALQIIPTLVPHPAGREGENLFLDEAYLVPMVLALKSYETALIFAAVVFFVHVVQNKSHVKTLFNTIQIAFAAGAGALIGSLIGSLPGAVIGAIVYAAMSALTVGVLLSRLEQRPFKEWLFNDIGFRIAMLVSSLSLGVCMQIAITGYPEIFPLVAMGVVGFQMAYQRARNVGAIPALVRV